MVTPVTGTPVLDLMKRMTEDSIEASNLDAKELMLVRLAALVAVDAPPASYLLNLEAASDLGIDADDVRGVLRCRTDRWHAARGARRGQHLPRAGSCVRARGVEELEADES